MVDSYTKLQSSEFLGRTGQLIVVEVKAQQLGQPPNLGRNGACQHIFNRKTLRGIPIATKRLFRTRTGQLLIVVEVKVHQLGQHNTSSLVGIPNCNRASFFGHALVS